MLQDAIRATKDWATRALCYLPVTIFVALIVFNLPDLRLVNVSEAKQAQITIMDILVFEEGYRSKPYLDSEGYLTIGIGHKLSTVKGIDPDTILLTMSRKEAMVRANQIYMQLKEELSTGKYSETFNHLNSARQATLISMAYQMGIHGLYKFKKMWGALYLECYDVAYYEALDSKWAKKQSNKRAKRQAEVLRTGQLINYEMELNNG